MRAIAVIAIAAVLVLCMASTSEAARFEKKMAHLTEEFVAKVNELAKGKWVASLTNGRHVTGASRDDIRSLMGVLSHDTSSLDKRQFTAEELRDEIPENFDSSENWPNCPTIARISDQSECGSCWAMAATGAFSDRLCTAGGMQDTQISAGNLLSCCSYCGDGCDGGYPSMAWRYFQWNGVLSEYCQPYPFPHCSHHTDSDVYPPCNGSQPTPTCNSTCSDKDIPTRRYYGASAYSVSGVEAFQRELMAHGPFEVSFDVYEDFLSYKSGVYQHVSGDELGGHAVRIVGWGVDNGTPYWKIANSWNEGWGEDGYFRIIRGQDECGIESSGTAGLPAHPTVC